MSKKLNNSEINEVEQKETMSALYKRIYEFEDRIGTVMIIGSIFLLFGVVAALYLTTFLNSQSNSNCTPVNEISTVLFNGEANRVRVLVADSNEERQQGLMFVDSLPIDKGMLFLYENDTNGGFWMKNTLIPLDMIFISSDLMIVDINENAQPCTSSECPTYYPLSNYRYVLEVNSGYSNDKGLEVGDYLEFGYVEGECIEN